jgi:hypothetical protein
MRQPKRLEMPVEVFVNAVRMANEPCPENAESHPAIQCITSWWNATARRKYLYAYGFSLYVRFGEDWLSGDPEEGWVLKDSWEKYEAPKAEATLLDGKISFVFFRPSIDAEHFYDALAVDGSEGTSGGKWAGITGNGILTRYSHQALSIFPRRFPEVWCEICALVDDSVVPSIPQSQSNC